MKLCGMLGCEPTNEQLLILFVFLFFTQSTCLSILQSILDFNNEQEFSTALKTIPLEPLLNLLQISDVDSGAFDLRHSESPPPYPPSSHERPRHRRRSTCSQSSYDDRPREMSPIVAANKATVQRNNSGASDARSDVWPPHPYSGYTMQKKNSICSMGSSVEGDHSFPLYRSVMSLKSSYSSASQNGKDYGCFFVYVCLKLEVFKPPCILANYMTG